MAKVKNMNKKIETIIETDLDEREIELGIATDDNFTENVKNKLESMGIDYNLFSNKIQEYLYRIESIISEKTTLKKEGLKIIKTATFNLNSIADTMKISRTTLYNNEILEIYIKHSKEVFDKDDPYTSIDILKASIHKLEKQVSDMVDRDIDFELIKHQVLSLNLELSKKEKAYKDVLERRNILSAENTKLRAELRELKRTVGKESTEPISKIRSLNKIL
jgi:hypothetical protein